jgi:hypothetical protein
MAHGGQAGGADDPAELLPLPAQQSWAMAEHSPLQPGHLWRRLTLPNEILGRGRRRAYSSDWSRWVDGW